MFDLTVFLGLSAFSSAQAADSSSATGKKKGTVELKAKSSSADDGERADHICIYITRVALVPEAVWVASRGLQQ